MANHTQIGIIYFSTKNQKTAYHHIRAKEQNLYIVDNEVIENNSFAIE